MKTVEQGLDYYFYENKTGEPSRVCRFCYRITEDAFVFTYEIQDDDLQSPYARENDPIWEGDAAEVFISPDGDLTRYLELEVAPNGTRFCANIVNMGQLVIQTIEPLFESESILTETGYRVKITMPIASMKGYDPEKVRLNAFCLDKRADGEQRLYALNPTGCETFHRPAFFVTPKR